MNGPSGTVRFAARPAVQHVNDDDCVKTRKLDEDSDFVRHSGQSWKATDLTKTYIVSHSDLLLLQAIKFVATGATQDGLCKF